ncbi:MAG: hypothetical protein PHO53_00975 [Actinomycetota bacterium]|nr:hypothetical protein [Actinomycetota bacterium]
MRVQPKKAFPYLRGLLIFALLATFWAWTWTAEARYINDEAPMGEEIQKRNIDTAKAIEPLVSRLEELQRKYQEPKLKTEEKAQIQKELIELQNIIGGMLPDLVVSQDENGNSIIVSPTEARKILDALKRKKS